MLHQISKRGTERIVLGPNGKKYRLRGAGWKIDGRPRYRQRRRSGVVHMSNAAAAKRR